MSEEKRFLEDCPHCGGTAAVKAFPKPYRHGWVGCAKCSCYIQWQHDPGGAIAKWNRRAAPAKPYDLLYEEGGPDA